jgi:hypothetical protein
MNSLIKRFYLLMEDKELIRLGGPQTQRLEEKSSLLPPEIEPRSPARSQTLLTEIPCSLAIRVRIT